MITKINNYLRERIYLVIIGIILLTIVTLILTLLPVDKVLPDKVWTFDKLGHVLLFGSWTFSIGYYRLLTKPKSVHLFTIFLLGVCFGAAVEGLQYVMVFHRTPDYLDTVFDTLGCFIAVLGLYLITENDTI